MRAPLLLAASLSLAGCSFTLDFDKFRGPDQPPTGGSGGSGSGGSGGSGGSVVAGSSGGSGAAGSSGGSGGSGGCVRDNCGRCDNDPRNDCVQDCRGVWGGMAYEDSCFVCDADPSNDDITCQDPPSIDVCIAAFESAAPVRSARTSTGCKTCVCDACGAAAVSECDDVCWGLLDCVTQACNADSTDTTCIVSNCVAFVAAAPPATSLNSCAFSEGPCVDICALGVPDDAGVDDDGGA